MRVAKAGLLAEGAERSQQTRGMLRVGHGAAFGHLRAGSSAVWSSCPSRPARPLERPASGARPVCTARARARPSGPALSARRSSGSPRNAPAPSAAQGAGAFKEPRRCVISPRRPRALGPSLTPAVAGSGQSEASFLCWILWSRSQRRQGLSAGRNCCCGGGRCTGTWGSVLQPGPLAP